MTFATRDRYRHVVEGIARRTRLAEPEVAAARRAAGGGRRAAVDTDDPDRHHVGFYLVSEGRAELEDQLGYRPSPGEALHRWVLQHPNAVFVGGVLATLADSALARRVGRGARQLADRHDRGTCCPRPTSRSTS
jgi:cyclic beta-1,2-glucan synthetase